MTTLPKPLVLSYIGAANSSVRVRRTAFLSILVLGILCFVSGGALTVISAVSTPWREFSEEFKYILGGPAPSGFYMIRTRSEVALRMLGYFSSDTPLIPGMFWLAMGTSGLITAWPIMNGKRWGAILAMPLLAMIFLVLMFTAVSCFAAGLLAVMPIGGLHTDPMWHVVFFAPALLLTFLSACCFDLFGFLRWIARQAMGEKPKKKFIG